MVGCFTPLQTYKVLKRRYTDFFQRLLFYTITNLQGSQTDNATQKEKERFHTITNLQGSQTACFLYIFYL